MESGIKAIAAMHDAVIHQVIENYMLANSSHILAAKSRLRAVRDGIVAEGVRLQGLRFSGDA